MQRLGRLHLGGPASREPYSHEDRRRHQEPHGDVHQQEAQGHHRRPVVIGKHHLRTIRQVHQACQHDLRLD